MLCSSNSQRHPAEPCKCRSAMAESGCCCTLVAFGLFPISPLPVEAADQVGQIWTEADGEGRWVQPWSSTWQHLLPCLLCQCDRRYTHTCRDQQRVAGNYRIWGFLPGGLIVAQVWHRDPPNNVHVELCGGMTNSN